MPRRARLRFAGVPLHIIQRGNNRIACFFATEDYRFYLHHLEELAQRFNCDVHAYVLMTNHVHLLVTPSETDSASLLMKHLGQRYVQYVNRVYRRSGTLWEGRFKSSLVQQQGYLLKCQRYIELNPVRASMVPHPRDYPWSSYRANGELLPSSLVTPHDGYSALGETPEQRAAAYRQLCQIGVEEEVLKEIRSAANGNFALGSQRFKDEISAMLGRRVGRLRERLRQRAA
jgi:putative transposase